MIQLPRTVVLSATLLGAASLMAAESPRFGIQGGISLPQGDLSDTAKMGVQLGGLGRWDFGSGHGLIARVEFTTYGKKDFVTCSSLMGGAEYTYHFERAPRGFYVMGGISYLSGTFKAEGSVFGQSFSETHTKGAVGYTAGAGYDLNRNLGFQVRLNSHHIEDGTWSSLNLGVTYTF